ncbi:MAG: hypothetical protein KGN34_02910 [Sphingomonadales bacterium]|nr:hypothetical protein [Sphingomonadales bacterium]
MDIDDDLFGAREDDIGHEPLPPLVGQDERRLQVRAYNYWASLLGNRNFPAISDFHPEDMPDLAPYAVVLDFAEGIENPGVTYLGDKLGEECGSVPPIRSLADIPSRSLLSRITDHYLQILANEAPIGFEAEFVNLHGKTVVYRGILLPFSGDGATIHNIVGVINWKELADQATTDALLAEIDKALAGPALPREAIPVWADGPIDPGLTPDDEPDVLDLAAFGDLPFPELALPDAPLPSTIRPETAPAPCGDDEPSDLAGWLESARALAAAAQGSDDRTRLALYAAIGRAWDFALAAAAAPEEFAGIVAGAGLAMQERAPLTPVVKLVFGPDYDKTRLTEYATALAHAQRLALGRGALAGYLAVAPGGLKGVVQEERRIKRAASGRGQASRAVPRESLARKLRRMPSLPLETFAAGDTEFAILLARRLESGEVVLLGEAADDAALLERTVRRVLR